jgi:hypothetical protein
MSVANRRRRSLGPFGQLAFKMRERAPEVGNDDLQPVPPLMSVRAIRSAIQLRQRLLIEGDAGAMIVDVSLKILRHASPPTIEREHTLLSATGAQSLRPAMGLPNTHGLH